MIAFGPVSLTCQNKKNWLNLPEEPIVPNQWHFVYFAIPSMEDKGLIMLLVFKKNCPESTERMLWWNSPSEGVSTYAWKNWKMVFEIGQAIYITVGKHTLKFSFGKLYRKLYLVAVE